MPTGLGIYQYPDKKRYDLCYKCPKRSYTVPGWIYKGKSLKYKMTKK